MQLRFSPFNKFLIISVIVAAFFYALPNLFEEGTLPQNLPQDKINLGLDLQGGSHLVLAVQLPDVINRAYQNMEDEVRGLLRDSKLGYRNLRASGDNVTFTGFRETQHPEIMRVLRDEITDADLVQDGMNFTLKFTEERLGQLHTNAMLQTLEILRARVDEFGVSEPVIQRQGDDRIIVQLPGIDDVERAKGIIGRTAQLTFHLVDEQTSPYGHMPPGRKVLYEISEEQEGIRPQRIPYVVHSRPHITGELLSDASTGFAQTGEVAVNITFDGRGTRKFAKLSADNVGKRFAIVLDDVVYSAPVIREPILGGSAQITGSFTPQTGEDLATVLRAGALPAKVEVVEERTVGPSLGQDSIEAGEIAIAIGFVAVMMLMFVYYGKFGTAANIALLLNVILLVGIMSAMGFTLTLPGIAGILLTIGMAVDANVLIFERIREELDNGRKPHTAFTTGFQSATTTILDANITTLIAAIVLFSIGSGPIKGFALTLTVGILSSMFTAVLVTRMLLAEWLHATRPKVVKI